MEGQVCGMCEFDEGDPVQWYLLPVPDGGRPLTSVEAPCVATPSLFFDYDSGMIHFRTLNPKP